jgi:methyltransferase (TIGR00027 family)
MMKDGTASYTAQRVAARRLSFPRAEAPYGNPAADEALAADLAAGMQPGEGGMQRHLRTRTAFFDHVVVSAIARDVPQIVVAGAGYDGRALRYAKPGVRWFELDHPDTQRDKLDRLRRLGIDAGSIRFAAADFSTDPVTGPLLAAGLRPDAGALFLLEGVAVYLDKDVLERLLAQFREVTTGDGRLAISVSTDSSVRGSQGRSLLAERVAALGETMRSVLEPGEATDLLARAGWRVLEPARAPDADAAADRERMRASGLLFARAAPPRAAPRRPASQRPASQGPASQRTASQRTVSRHAVSRDVAADGTAVRPAADPAGLSLMALLSWALVAYTIEFDNESEHRLPHRTTLFGVAPGAAPGSGQGAPPGSPWLISLAMWASSLRHLGDGACTAAELAGAARTGTNLAGLRRWGYITIDPDPGTTKPPRKDALIRATAAGRYLNQVLEPLGAEIEQRWRDRLGGQADELRRSLEALVARLDAGLPDCVPIGDPRQVAPGAGRPAGPGEAAALPLWALLSRALVAFAAGFGQQSGLALPASANVLRVLDERGVRVRDMPDRGGVSKEAVSMALGLLRRRGLAEVVAVPAGGRWQVARLTGSGTAARRDYRDAVATAGQRWRDEHGGQVIDPLGTALERLAPSLPLGLRPYPDGWRARVRAFATLPHFPMVLHRGGYPDGS